MFMNSSMMKWLVGMVSRYHICFVLVLARTLTGVDPTVKRRVAGKKEGFLGLLLI